MRIDRLLRAIAIGTTLLLPALGRAGLAVKPALQNIRPDSVNLMFETARSAASTLKIALRSDLSGAVTYTFAAATIRKVRITNLVSGTRYYYQVSGDGETSAVGTFLAPQPDGSRLPFRLVVYGDSRLATWYEDILAAAGDNDDHGAVVQSIKSYAPDFVLHLGDFAENGNDTGAVRNFFSVEKDFLVNTPMVATYGNHEFNGKSGSTASDTYFDSYLTPPTGAPDFSYYSYNYGNVHVLVISTGKYVYSDESYDLILPGTPQYNFIKSDLAAAASDPSVDRIFVAMHVPLFSVANFGDNPTLIKTLEPLFTSAGVDVVFTAHEHDYQHLYRNGIHYVLTGGAGGPILDILSCNCQAATAAKLLRFEDELNYVIVDVNGSSLHFQVRGVQGDGNSSSWSIESFDL